MALRAFRGLRNFPLHCREDLWGGFYPHFEIF